MLLEFVQEVLGRHKVVQEVPKTIMLIGRLQDRKDLGKKRKTEKKMMTQANVLALVIGGTRIGELDASAVCQKISLLWMESSFCFS